ncbi:hypothetical protein NC651_006520 [Populus alba x Populus x berolinensis]|nr:hypothetical protein NC651_006520 [Populus alba x Populus x berolinensis]
MHEKGAGQEESWVHENSGVVGQWDRRGKREYKYRRWCEPWPTNKPPWLD